MVATEMFELLHAIGAEAKSIVFSDSRQDAANQSLEIERLHLRDLRREILVSAARALLAEAQASHVSPEEQDRIAREYMAKGDTDGLIAKAAEWAKAKAAGVNLRSRKIRLDFLLQYGIGDRTLSRITSEFVGLGIHPSPQRLAHHLREPSPASVQPGSVSRRRPRAPARNCCKSTICAAGIVLYLGLERKNSDDARHPQCRSTTKHHMGGMS
jgi:hypothetical protein